MTSTGHISLFVGAGLAPPGVNPGTFFCFLETTTSRESHDCDRRARLQSCRKPRLSPVFNR